METEYLLNVRIKYFISSQLYIRKIWFFFLIIIYFVRILPVNQNSWGCKLNKILFLEYNNMRNCWNCIKRFFGKLLKLNVCWSTHVKAFNWSNEQFLHRYYRLCFFWNSVAKQQTPVVVVFLRRLREESTLKIHLSVYWIHQWIACLRYIYINT